MTFSKLDTTLAGAALTLALNLSVAPVAHAATITVSGGCTLVDAISAANTDAAVGSCTAGSGADTIILTGNVTLTAVDNGRNGLPVVSSVITIDGNGATIERSSAGGTPDFRIFEVNATGDLTLNQTTISGGADSGFDSGGIFVDDGTLTLTNSTVSGNTADYGGGIQNDDGTVIVTNSTISGNTADSGGGDLATDENDDTVTMTNSTIANNVASGSGGAIWDEEGSPVTITNSTISGNRALFGGGIYRARSAGNYGNQMTITNFGGPGDDQLHGGNDDDFLDGEAGNDEYDGAGGTDTCLIEDGEMQVNCEIFSEE